MTDKMIFTSMNGANQTWLAQAVHMNNLANVNTTGFRADLEHVISEQVNGGQFPTRVNSKPGEPVADFSQGTLMTTGRDLDMAIPGDGWFVVRGENGKEAWTRAGNFRITENGALVTADGRAVLGSGGEIAIPPYQQITIGKDGTISIRPVGQPAESLAQIDQLRLANPDVSLLRKGQDGLFYVTEGGVESDPSVTVENGMLETSNVNTVTSLVEIMSAARLFELQVKMMQTAEKSAEDSTTLMRMG